MEKQGVNFLLEHATAKFEVGTKAHNPANPAQRGVYVQADDAIVTKCPVVTDSAIGGSGAAANAPYVVTGSTVAEESVVGISPIAVTAGYYFWAVNDGPVEDVLAEATADTINMFLVTHATDSTVDVLGSTAVNPTQDDFNGLVAAVAGVRMKAITAVGGGTIDVLCSN